MTFRGAEVQSKEILRTYNHWRYFKNPPFGPFSSSETTHDYFLNGVGIIYSFLHFYDSGTQTSEGSEGYIVKRLIDYELK